MISGKDLIALGIKQGKWYSAIIEYANIHGLEGEALKAYALSMIPEEIDPHAKSVPFFKNIDAESEEELVNMEKVFQSMETLMYTPTIVNGAIMPDACPTGSNGQIPVGGVAVAKNAIHPNMHSADICCSVMATNFGIVDPKQVMDAAHGLTHFGPGGRKELFPIQEELLEKMASNYFLKSDAIMHMAKTHLGTQGDGNHFLYVGQSQNTGETYLVTHHGSRGVGARLFKEGMKVAEHYRSEIAPKTLKANAWIPFDTELGRAYWDALQLVRAWTKLNHSSIHDATLEQLQTVLKDRFWNEHNFVFKRGDLFYHAKGATPLLDEFVPDSKEGLRLIPLNMAEPILVVKGTESASNLGFAPHGAGRNISRSAQKRKLDGQSNEEVFRHETQGLDIRFYSGNIDVSELPSAYKNAEAVKDQMQRFGLGEVVDEILPYGCIMAGDWKKDAPWKKRKSKS